MTTHDDSIAHLVSKIRGLAMSQRVLLVTLSCYPDRRVRLTMRQLARDVGTTEEAVARDVADLEARGLLTVWRVVGAEQAYARMVFVLPLARLIACSASAPSKAGMLA